MDNKLMKKIMGMEESPMKDHEKSAKMDMLQQLIREMDAIIGEDLSSEDKPQEMQKVTVAADSQEDLMKGLEKAEDMIEKMPMKDMGKSGMEDELDDDMY